jgi:hypothetical protein
MNINLSIHVWDKKMMRGLTFCTVRSIKRTHQCKGSAILGTQPWKGATPSFTNKANKTNRFILSAHDPRELEAERIPNNKIEEAKAWVKKYLTLDSLSPLELSFRINGMNPKVFNSKPNQHMDREEEQETKIRLHTIMPENKMKEGVSQIREEIWLYGRGMSPKA